MPILALDVGSRRIGLALTDSSEQFVFPLRVLDCTNTHSDIQAILDVAAEYRVDIIVVGDPLGLNGERGPAAQRIDQFCDVLHRAFSGKLERVDERMTTAQATKTLIAADVSRKRRRRVVDGLAAGLILESYLSRRRLSGNPS
ncbi:MAG TPA: Holliday junction resolvase RuvX [Candidatus Baltobacteraceae bacterium]|jgi:putative Holliday junction resolvase|nr:Holliday junction resolvase RuvX [Candidatus Baltobacteraceae bacterium]